MQRLRFSSFTWILLSLFGLISCRPEPPIEPVEPAEVAPLTDAEQVIADALDGMVVPISSTPFDITDTDLQVLDYLADTKIVGLGEATHGTREFFQMKHRVFQYLVEQHGFDAFLFEMDFAEAMLFDRWIQGEIEGDLRSMMRDEMLFWTWKTDAVEDLYTWMRDYNRANPDKRIHLYGVDTQSPNYSLKELLRRLELIMPTTADSVRFYIGSDYERMLDLYNSKDQIAADRIQNSLEEVRKVIEEAKNAIIRSSSEEAYTWIERLVTHMEQVEAHSYQYFVLGQGPLRDKYMADNTRWLSDQMPEGSQVALWAHNYHVSNTFTGNLFNDSQGGYLRQRYQDDYQIIGFGMNTGRFTAFNRGTLKTNTIPTVANRSSYNYLFSHMQNKNFILRFDQVTSSDADAWLRRAKPFLSLGAVYQAPASNYYYPIILTSMYDVLIYFDNTGSTLLIR